MRLTFIITNPNHHWNTMGPLIDNFVTKSDHTIEVISFCELRRMSTPKEVFDYGFKVYTFLDLKKTGLSTKSGAKSLGDKLSFKRKLFTKLLWTLVIYPKIRGALKRSDAVIACNDSSAPSKFIFQKIKSCKKTKSFLLQEGIRFKQEGDSVPLYGRSGVNVILAWGKDSAHHFEEYVPAQTKVLVTGSPRYDAIIKQIQLLNRTTNKCIGLFTNPIDDIRFCSYDEKLALTHDLLAKAIPVLKGLNYSVILKCHPRESIEDYKRALKHLDSEIIQYADNGESIEEVFERVDKSIVYASTVGLESLIFNLPVGVVKIYDKDYGHDYYQKGAAMGLDLSSPEFESQFQYFVESYALDEKAKSYVVNNLAHLGGAVETAQEAINSELHAG